MITFLLALAALIAGYLIYGKVVERAFGPDERPTPAQAMADGVDFVELPTWKVFLIQILNIAGLGPITGAIMGALWGPVVYLWIVLGSIFAGATHDYLTGMLSMRHQGASVSELIGKYLGRPVRQVMTIWTAVLLVMVGTVFSVGSAGLLAMLTPEGLSKNFWLVVILIYFFIATFVPIDKVIGRIYPLFGVCLLIMAVGVGAGLMVKGYPLPELWDNFGNLHPEGKPIWAFMFVTVACGAISGFHATQSPMMARCLRTEKHGRSVFYGAMVAEGAIALVWAAAGVAFYNGTGGLLAAINVGTANGVVFEVCTQVLGPIGGVLAMIGVIACPITSGDTAFRSARLTLADWLHKDQQTIVSRLWLTVPLLAAGAVIGQFDYQIIWRYFSWSNQTLAMVTLWAVAVYLYRARRGTGYFLIAMVPAVFMSAVCMTYILQAPEGFGLLTTIAYPAGIAFAGICLALFLLRGKERQALG